MWLPALATIFWFFGTGGITVIILWVLYAMGMSEEGFANKYPVENNEDVDHRRDRGTSGSDVMVSAFPGRV